MDVDVYSCMNGNVRTSGPFHNNFCTNKIFCQLVINGRFYTTAKVPCKAQAYNEENNRKYFGDAHVSGNFIAIIKNLTSIT